jgi:hypothetical protein
MNKFQDAIEVFIGLSNVNCVSDVNYETCATYGSPSLTLFALSFSVRIQIHHHSYREQSLGHLVRLDSKLWLKKFAALDSKR